MIDGIKVDCYIADLQKWSEALGLIGRFSERTGEVLGFAEAEVNGCTFTRASAASADRYIFQGSIHKFMQGNNANDFSHAQLIKAVEHLRDVYGIDPQKSRVINFEFGVNITLPNHVKHDAQDFQKFLISAYSKAFEQLNPKKPGLGYKASFNEYVIKVYDKGKQAKTGEKNKLRVEIKVNRTRFLKQYNTHASRHLFLSDLTSSRVLSILGDILSQKTRSLILSPRLLDEANLSIKQRLTFRECRDSRSWEEWTPRQRQARRRQLMRIFEDTNLTNPADELAELVRVKWSELSKSDAHISQPKRGENGSIIQLIVSGFRHLFSFTAWLFAHRYFFRLVISKMLHYPIAYSLQGYRLWINRKARSPPCVVVN